VTAPRRQAWLSVLVAIAVAGAVAIALRAGTNVGEKPAIWDEDVMLPVVTAIVEGGWTAEHLLDYEDTKGPAFFWTYALAAEIVGADLAALRGLSIACFVLGAGAVGWLAARCGFRPALVTAVALLFALTPYLAVLGQLFMSEASFVLGALALALVVTSALGADDRARSRLLGPVAFGVLLAILLHHRPHAAAYAGAAILVALERRRGAAWPWLVAAAAAGLARLPFYIHWGGLVSPSYQAKVELGVRLESVTYLLVALLPATAVMPWPLLRESTLRRRWAWLAAGAAAGLLLGALAAPDLAGDTGGKFRGLVASVLTRIGPAPLRAVLLALLAGLGGAALAALIAVTTSAPLRDARTVAIRFAGWVVLLGCALYAFTRGDVYDRYVAVFLPLLPLVYVDRLPRWLVALQAAMLAAFAGALALRWLT
jgi:hypothetical protein